MKRYLCLFLFAACVFAQSGEFSFRNHLQTVYDGWCSLNPDNVAKYYAADGVYYDVAPLKYTGWAEYAAGFKKTFVPMAKSAKVEIGPDFQVMHAGAARVVTFTAHFTMVDKQDKTQEFDIRATEIMEKRGKDWIIVHEHVSAPLPGN